MKNTENEILFRKRLAHFGAITAKLSIVSTAFVVVVSAGLVLHQMTSAILLMLWFTVTICTVGLLLLNPVWRGAPGRIIGSLDFVASLFAKLYSAFWPLVIIAIVCAALSIVLGLIESDKKPTGRIVLCVISAVVAVITMIATGGAAQ